MWKTKFGAKTLEIWRDWEKRNARKYRVQKEREKGKEARKISFQLGPKQAYVANLGAAVFGEERMEICFLRVSS